MNTLKTFNHPAFMTAHRERLRHRLLFVLNTWLTNQISWRAILYLCCWFRTFRFHAHITLCLWMRACVCLCQCMSQRTFISTTSFGDRKQIVITVEHSFFVEIHKLTTCGAAPNLFKLTHKWRNTPNENAGFNKLGSHLLTIVESRFSRMNGEMSRKLSNFIGPFAWRRWTSLLFCSQIQNQVLLQHYDLVLMFILFETDFDKIMNIARPFNVLSEWGSDSPYSFVTFFPENLTTCAMGAMLHYIIPSSTFLPFLSNIYSRFFVSNYPLILNPISRVK